MVDLRKAALRLPAKGTTGRLAFGKSVNSNFLNMITGTHIHYYHLCHRKLWLFANGIRMEQNSDLVAAGKFIHETTYTKRADKYKELDLGFVKIDHYDAQNKVIHEVKKSPKLEFVHVAQLKYYIYVMLQNEVEGVTGILEYPKQRTTKTVELSQNDVTAIEGWKTDIQRIIQLENCPDVVQKPFCKNCAYFDYCFI